MRNDRLMKKLLLQIIEQHDGCSDWNTLQSKTKAHFFAHKIQPIPNNTQLTHALYLFEKDGAVERVEQLPTIYYKLTPWGHALVGSWYKKWAHFLVYKNHNLIALIALILSIVAIVLSDRVWDWLSAAAH